MIKTIENWVRRHVFWFQVGGVVTVSLILALLMNLSWGAIPSRTEIGRIAVQDIRADKDYEIVDHEATEKLRQDAKAGVLPVYDWDESSSSEKIIKDPQSLDPWKEKGVFIRSVSRPEQPKVLLKDLGSVLSLEQARAEAARKMKTIKNMRKGTVYTLVTPEEIRPNFFYNDSETKAAEEKALAEVKPVIIKILAGESIIRSGDRFEARHVKIIEGIRREKTQTFGRMRVIGTFLFLTIFLSVLLFVLQRSSRKLRLTPKDLLFMGTTLVIVVLFERLFLFVYGAVRVLLPIEIPLTSFYAMIPVAFGAMMVRLVMPMPMAILLAPICAAIAGFILQGNLNYMLYYLVGTVLGIQLMANVRTRGQILKSGVELGLFHALVLLSLDMVNVTSVAGVVSLEDSGIRVAFAFLGGMLNVILVLILMPICESVFNYLTPIKLLEYGSLNHPLLREMIVRAPGTYHHSHMVGTLAEAACEAIGADSLFARVASYFHDIGKMKKSPYFVENQSAGGGEDRHASLAPSMSALIIASHVKDGLEIAKAYNLPRRIADIIPQHQGTKLISYFYNRAKEKEDPEMDVVSERDYRYAGPKPQTREAGVILLADTVEAATRSLKDRTPARLEEVVRNMINKNFIDGQLDECELTLKDLHTIASSFMRILVGIYHQRIEYPPDMQERLAKEISLEEAHADKYKQSTPLRADSIKEAQKIPPKNIHRIGN